MGFIIGSILGFVNASERGYTTTQPIPATYNPKCLGFLRASAPQATESQRTQSLNPEREP